jgi:hypothetical protein
MRFRRSRDSRVGDDTSGRKIGRGSSNRAIVFVALGVVRDIAPVLRKQLICIGKYSRLYRIQLRRIRISRIR